MQILAKPTSLMPMSLKEENGSSREEARFCVGQ